MGTIDGQLRSVRVEVHTVESSVAAARKANPTVPGHVAVPFAGAVTPQVCHGASVRAGEVVATIEVMKMEASITAPVDGVVAELVVPSPRQSEAGDLMLVIDEMSTQAHDLAIIVMTRWCPRCGAWATIGRRQSRGRY